MLIPDSPEFEGGGEQRFIFGGCLVTIWTGYWIEVRRIRDVKKV
jgi:hypothetical protein